LQAARTLGLQLQVVNASAENDFGAAFATLLGQGVGALVVAADPFFNARRGQLVALAARHAIPPIYEWREFAAAGGLMSYGTVISYASWAGSRFFYEQVLSLGTRCAPASRAREQHRIVVLDLDQGPA